MSVLSGTFFAFVLVDFGFANFSSTCHERILLVKPLFSIIRCNLQPTAATLL